jgi:hypothetical protein
LKSIGEEPEYFLLIKLRRYTLRAPLVGSGGIGGGSIEVAGLIMGTTGVLR